MGPRKGTVLNSSVCRGEFSDEMMPSAISWFINEFKAAHSTQIDFIERFSAALVALDFTPVSQLVIVLNLRPSRLVVF